MFLWKPLLRMRAKNVEFVTPNHELSDGVQDTYSNIKSAHKRLTKQLSRRDFASKEAPPIVRDFLYFYLSSETLALSLFNELFRPSFYDSVNKKRPLFLLLNKLLKIFITTDFLRLDNPELFCAYSLSKLKHPKSFRQNLNQTEEARLDILHSITLPMGRMILSLFADKKKELFYPSLLSKRSRILLDAENKKTLYTIAKLAEIQNFKYISLFLSSVYNKFYGTSSYKFDSEAAGPIAMYLDLLQAQE